MSQSFSNSYSNIVADDRSNVLSWLSSLDPRSRHQDIQDHRVKDIGEWLLQTEEFKHWHAGSGGDESDNAILFCYGTPGVGKTFISSLVIDTLCGQNGERSATVAYFYFDFAAREEQSPTNMMGALLSQIVRERKEFPREIVQAYEDQKKVIGGRRPRLPDIVKMLQTTASEKPTFICIDSLDECAPGHRVKILNSLNQILQRSPGTRVFVTGRPHIRAEVEKGLSGRVVAVPITPARHDIVSYIRTRLGEDETPDAMDRSLKADILRKIPEDISEIFLLVSLNIDAILQETTIGRRRQRLHTMANGSQLEDAYGTTLSRIKGQGGEKSRLGMTALMWISHSERPLEVDELCHALGVEIGLADFDADNVPSIGTVLACCQGLVVVDKEASTVRLIHFTLQEYLQAHPELFGTPHSTMAETCLSFLNSRQIKSLPASRLPDIGGVPPPRDSSRYPSTPFPGYSPLYLGSLSLGHSSLYSIAPLLARSSRYSSTPPERPPLHSVSSSLKYPSRCSYAPFLRYPGLYSPTPSLQSASPYSSTPFLEYSSLYWGMHAKRDLSNCAKVLALELFSHYSNHISTKILLNAEDSHFFDVDSHKPSLFSGLHCASFFGIVEIVADLIEVEGCDINQTDWTGHTPLAWAALNEHEGVVKILLDRNDINPDRASGPGETPLWCAAKNGHEGVVKILLGRDEVNPDNPNEDGRTPLWCAAESGHEGVVKILLERGDVNPDKPNVDGRTPLWCAAENGHEGVVKMLLERGDVNSDKPNVDERTPLWCAAKNGHEGVVKILLGQDNVDPNTLDIYGRTPLACTAARGHEGVTKLLLGREDVRPDKPDNYGRTPLWCAAEKGHEGVVKILLGRDEVNPDKPAQYGQSPLWCAALYGHEGVAKILLGRHDTNPDKPDRYGRTPLWCAAESGHEGVVKFLLERDDVNPDKPTESGQSPLWRAAFYGHEGVVKTLLGLDDVNPDTPDIYGRTPLGCAAVRGHEGVVEILLERVDVHPDKPDVYGRTPLWYASERGHAGVIALLRSPVSVTPSAA